MELNDTASSFDGSERWEEDDENDIDDEMDCDYKCLLSNDTFPLLKDAIAHDRQSQGFDFDSFRIKAQLDEIEVIKCINYIREAAGAQPSEEQIKLVLKSLHDSTQPWSDDRFMRPVLENDGYLLHDWEDGLLECNNSSQDVNMSQRSRDATEIATLIQRNEALASAVQMLAEYVPADLRTELFQNLYPESSVDGSADGLRELSVGEHESTQPSTSGLGGVLVQPSKQRRSNKEVLSVDESYFNSYSHLDIHREMLSDQARTSAYQQALECNPSLIRGARVMDVGCGTGILSMFAARGGAIAVTGVDGSDTMADLARQICTANGLEVETGGPITVIAGKIEEVQIAEDQKVDVIVSEWMGYMLLFETMLDSILYARDKWLKPGGAVLPDTASMYVAGAKESALGVEFWKNVYGFSMKPISDLMMKQSRDKAIVKKVTPEDIVTESQPIARFDICSMRKEDADFHTEFELRHKDGNGMVDCCALVVWFDVGFTERFCRDKAVLLDTSPSVRQTHWAQTVLPLRTSVKLEPGSSLKGRISVARSNIHRSLDISVEYTDPMLTGDMFAASYSLAMS